MPSTNESDLSMRQVVISFVFVVLFSLKLSSGFGQQSGHRDVKTQEKQTANPKKRPAKVKTMKVNGFKKVSKAGRLYLSGQFQPANLKELREWKIKKVISLRTVGEVKWDEPSAIRSAGMDFVRLPFRQMEQLNDKLFDGVRKELKSKKPVLLHCGSSNRVGGVWLTYRVLDEGVDLNIALKEAKIVGLRHPKIQAKALDYIRRKQKEKKGQ